MGSCAAPSAKGDDKFITTDYLQQCRFFFPKARQGSALGINGGLGNLGVSVMQLIAPLVIFL
ncbi:hypothetical protein K5830_24390, partial [Salmonella enterica]|nr:hypothetical protein [Salmonella enterica]